MVKVGCRLLMSGILYLISFFAGVPWYWKNRDLSQGFDEKINLSPGDCQKVQELLDQTFQHKGTRDRKDRLPSRLLVSQVIRMEHSRLWQRFERKKKEP